MKRSIFAFLVLLGALVISIASPLIYNQYVNQTQSEGGATEVCITADAVMQVTNPELTTVSDVMQFYQRSVEQYAIDSTFRTIPPEAVRTISTVLIGRTGRATKRAIVEEFKANYKNTYQFLKIDASAAPDNPNSQSADTLKLPPSTTEDTIIDGKVFKLVKETKNNG